MLYHIDQEPSKSGIENGTTVHAAGSSSGGISTASGKEAPRSNSDNKSIMNKYQKKVELTPTTIIMTNNNRISIILDDEEGIRIISNKDIHIESEKNLEISRVSESMTVEAAESVG